MALTGRLRPHGHFNAALRQDVHRNPLVRRADRCFDIVRQADAEELTARSDEKEVAMPRTSSFLEMDAGERREFLAADLADWIDAAFWSSAAARALLLRSSTPESARIHGCRT